MCQLTGSAGRGRPAPSARRASVTWGRYGRVSTGKPRRFRTVAAASWSSDSATGTVSGSSTAIPRGHRVPCDSISSNGSNGTCKASSSSGKRSSATSPMKCSVTCSFAVLTGVAERGQVHASRWAASCVRTASSGSRAMKRRAVGECVMPSMYSAAADGVATMR